MKHQVCYGCIGRDQEDSRNIEKELEKRLGNV